MLEDDNEEKKLNPMIEDQSWHPKKLIDHFLILERVKIENQENEREKRKKKERKIG